MYNTSNIWNYTYNFSSTFDGFTFFDETIGTEKHNTDLAGLQVQAHALDTGGESVIVVSIKNDIILTPKRRISWENNLLDQFFGLDIGQTVYTSNTITKDHPMSDLRPILHILDSVPFVKTYPTDKTRPVSANEAVSETPRILCSKMEETSVGVALASPA